MGHRHADTVLDSTPLKGKNTSSDGWQERETAEISSSLIAGFLYVFLTLRHILGRTLEVAQKALRIRITHRQVPSTALILFMLSEYMSEQSCVLLLLRASAETTMHQLHLFPGYSPYVGFSTITYILHEADSEGGFTAL